MDFKDSIFQLAERVSSLKDSIQTEEATKNAFIMPFIQILGYDVFNPLEVVPEMDCDIAKKKGEKIDYAIMKDGSKVSSYVFVRAVEIINRKYENVIRQFRVIQKEYDFFVVELVLDEDAVENLITEREVEDEFLYL